MHEGVPDRFHADIVRQAEALVSQIRGEAQHILDGLADRPKPLAKRRAQEAVARVLAANGELWRLIERSKPLRLTTENGS